MKVWNPAVCYKCNKPFSEKDFYAVKKKNGLKYDIYCKVCRKEYNVEYYKKNPIKRYTYKQKPCSKFRQNRPRENFSDFDDYFRLNPYHFYELYAMEYTKENSKIAYGVLVKLLKEF